MLTLAKQGAYRRRWWRVDETIERKKERKKERKLKGRVRAFAACTLLKVLLH